MVRWLSCRVRPSSIESSCSLWERRALSSTSARWPVRASSRAPVEASNSWGSRGSSARTPLASRSESGNQTAASRSMATSPGSPVIWMSRGVSGNGFSVRVSSSFSSSASELRTGSWRVIWTMAASSSETATARNWASTTCPRVSRAPRAASWKSLAAMPRSRSVLTTVACSREASRWRATRASTSTGPMAWRSSGAAPAAGAAAASARRRTRATRSLGSKSLVR
jgi:hypothetical protein